MPEKLTRTRRPKFEPKCFNTMRKGQHGRHLGTTESMKYSPRPQLGIPDDIDPKAKALKLQDDQHIPNATSPPSLKPAPQPPVAVLAMAANTHPGVHTPLAHLDHP